MSAQARRLDGGPHPDAAKLAQARDRAARALDKLAAALEHVPAAAGRDVPARDQGRAPDDPALGVTPADHTEAAALAQRQRHIREELQAILGEASRDRNGLCANAQPPWDARWPTCATGRKRSAHAAQWPARTAADLLGRAAPETMDRATVSLHQGRPGEALPAQRQAADQAEQAARHAEDLAAALRADRPPDTADHPTDDFAAAQAAARAAGQHLAQARARPSLTTEASQAALAAAAAAMHQAANGLRAGDRSTRGPARSRGPSTAANDHERGCPPIRAAPTSPDSRPRCVPTTGRTWGELPGHLRTEILQMSQGQYRDDYARLIELYFREIASDAGNQGARP